MSDLRQTDTVRIVYIIDNIRPVPVIPIDHVYLHTSVGFRPRLFGFAFLHMVPEGRLTEIRSQRWYLLIKPLLDGLCVVVGFL